MARELNSRLFRVSIDRERNYIFVEAENEKELIRYLADKYAGKREIFGAKEICRDGTLMTATIITNPLFKELFASSTAENSAAEMQVKPSLDEKLEIAASRAVQASASTFSKPKSIEPIH